MTPRATPHPNSPRAKAQRRRPVAFAESSVHISTPPIRIIGSKPPRPSAGFRLSDR
ncbi:MAG: hypothetical protein AABM29_06165 [Actinomycetota bacterium]